MANHSIGNFHAKAMAEAFKYSHAEKINVQNNRLDHKGALGILEAINENLTEINLSENQIRNISEKYKVDR